MVLNDATIDQIILCPYVCKTKILCANAVVCLTHTHKEKHGRYPPVDNINKILLYHDNCIECRCLKLSLTPQKEQQWSKDGATDIDNKDLVKHDDLEESPEHTCNDADLLMLKEEEKESRDNGSHMNSLVLNNRVVCGSTKSLKHVETDSFMAETLAIPTRTVCGRRSKEYFNDAKTITEVIPRIVGSSTKLNS
jgi:hypothetical protein